jgi:hypothetical protein
VIPSIYEDIKDNIFLALGGSNSLWENFYNMALSKSIIKLDLIGNLEFWTTYFFILYNFQVEDQNTIQYVSYWVIYSVLLVSIVISAMIGFVAIRKITKTYYILFFILRILAEAFKIYLIVQLWLGNTILMKKIV